MASLEQSVQFLKGVGPRRAAALHALGIRTVGDVLQHYPRRYEDRSAIKPIALLQNGALETLSGRVLHVSESKPRRGLTILKAMVGDGSGSAALVWFNQPFLKASLTPGRTVVATGKVARAYGQLTVNHPEFELVEDAADFQPQILPVYPTNEALTQKFLRALVQQASAAADGAEEVLPQALRARCGLIGHSAALRAIHFPQSLDEASAARRRLVFEELYLIQCGLLLIKRSAQAQQRGVRHLVSSKLCRAARESLPFSLTGAQEKALREIELDMERDVPMRRLLQGDVGSGKTAVALLALAKTVENGYQGALMAPTEILAEQHYRTLTEALAPCGVRVALLAGKLAKKARAEALEAVATGEADIAVGTHALIQDDVRFRRLGLVVTDEQHRFGVRQRARLTEKGEAPDVLVMTATPIPRTMTLTVYGDLDVSSIRELPPGRKPVRTFVRGAQSRAKVYEFVRSELAKGRQAYVVCPLVELSEAVRAQSAEEVYEELSHGIFRGEAVGLVHGKLPAKEKEAVMARFYAGELKLLVATTVIEVGVNVPNATVMVVEGAERFGLAQLHQLRGRIGRGSAQSYCILLLQNASQTAKERLAALEKTADGFLLAEEDLKLRGPGQFFGTRQHGLPDLKIADIFQDAGVLLEAREAAQATLGDSAQAAPIVRVLQSRYKEHFAEITCH